jgi:hypothetical protein
MENICLEDLWISKLKKEGWSDFSAARFPLHWAPSTLKLYNGMLNKLCSFCVSNQIAFPPSEERHLVDFMLELTNQSQRPESSLKSALAAVSCLYRVRCLEDISQSRQIHDFKDALVKCGTVKPMARSKVMPSKPFRDLFSSWPNNKDLSIKDLRLKPLL